MRSLLTMRLLKVANRQRTVRLGLLLAFCWLATALAVNVCALLSELAGLGIRLGAYLAGAGGFAFAVFVVLRERKLGPNIRKAAVEVERRYPELDSRLLAVIDSTSRPELEPGYCELRLIRETLEHSSQNDWTKVVPNWRLYLVRALNWGSLVLTVAAILNATSTNKIRPMLVFQRPHIEVTPGDTQLERGESLVIVARCTGFVPSGFELVLERPDESEQRIPMTKGLADPIYGVTVPNIDCDLNYRVEYNGGKTRTYRVKVFEYPKVERADAEITYPKYTGVPVKRFENIRILSAVEGSLCKLDFHLNKQVRSAKLVNPKREGESILLHVETNSPAAHLLGLALTNSAKYRIVLSDFEGRTNKVPFELTVTVFTNRPPELKLTWPGGDLRPTPLEEIRLSGITSDDYGIVAYGIGYSVPGRKTELVELGTNVPPLERRSFDYILPLEDLKVNPGQLVSWFAWADDLGPDGRVRRSTSDLFFGEVRPFDEVYRELKNTADETEERPADSAENEPGNEAIRLVELQKQILTATWRLQREQRSLESRAYHTNLCVLKEVQTGVLDESRSARDRAFDPRTVSIWHSAITNMESAVRALERASADAGYLSEAVDSEQLAYQALLQLNPGEYDVAMRRTRARSQRQNSRQQALQRQLDQLDLGRDANRYETERRAQSPLPPERREQLQVINRLRELAQRQQDLNERLRELQSALREARTEDARNRSQHQLKRLEEDQQQMLADFDELRHRVEESNSPSDLGIERSQLAQVRRDLERAADAMSRGSVPQALASGRRAQQQMQEMRDSLRRDAASELEQQLREMRAEARALTRNQMDIGRRLQSVVSEASRSLRDPPRSSELLDLLTQQKQRLTNLLDKATQVSELTELNEPGVSRELYDALRTFTQQDTEAAKTMQQELIDRGLMTRALYDRMQSTIENDRAKIIQATAEMLRQGYLTQAQEAEHRARTTIERLSSGVERAADRVLGSDTEALRFAQRELDDLTQQLERELAQAGVTETNRTSGPGQNARIASSSPQQNGHTADSQQAFRNQAAQIIEALGPTAREPENEVTASDAGPITGPGFTQWSDRLRELEEIIELPWVRDELAKARERARQFRLEFRRELKKPDWAVLKMEVLRPLVEVRREIADELARREPVDRLAPIDRDPVPARYAEAVRRYYEELGK